MLCSVKTIEGCAIAASDGAIGHVKDLLFDDRSWVVRYLVVDCGHWLPGRKVLISPRALTGLDRAGRTLSVAITQDRVRNSPDIATDQPVSRQHEMQFNDFHGYPAYWGGMGYWGSDMYPNMSLPGYGGFGSPEAIREAGESAVPEAEAVNTPTGDPHLRSHREVVGYQVHADDGEVGRVDGLLVDDQTWAIRYLVVDTSRSWIGHRVLVAPSWIRDVSWATATVSLRLSRESIRTAPHYDVDGTMSRLQEADLRRHFDRAVGHEAVSHPHA
jgi:hypothetical protein